MKHITLRHADGATITLHTDTAAHTDAPTCYHCHEPVDTGDPIVVTNEQEGPFCCFSCAEKEYESVGFLRGAR